MDALRIEKLQNLLNEQSIDALLLIPSPSLYYLTGLSFHLMERPIIGIFPRKGAPTFCLPEFELSNLQTSELSLAHVTYDENPASQQEAVRQALQAAGLEAGSSIAVEPLRFRYYEWRLLQGAAQDLDIRSAEDLTERMRMSKDAAEIKAMQTAVVIAEKALQDTLPMIQPGISELELRAELVSQLLRHGSDTQLPFQPIVASGPNSALPHAGASQRRLGSGEFVLIDWGASYQGYVSDLSRTFAVAEADDRMESIYQAVLQANEAGRQAVAPGVTAGSIDKAARDQIEEAGFGPQFTHRVGHGLGLDTHEPPFMFGENQRSLAAGMAFTVEPGVYIEGFGGVRIEDNVVVTEDGGRSLSQFHRQLQVVG